MSTHHRTSPSVVGAALDRDLDDELPEDAEALALELGRDALPPRDPRLDAETREALGVDEATGVTLIAEVCHAIGRVLATGRSLEVLGFGRFRVRPYRPARPAFLGDTSFVEAPYLGPVEFLASALLQRQVDNDALEPSIVARCDELYAALRDDPHMPRGRVPQLIKGAFRAITAVLLAHHIVLLPGVGYLVSRPRPGQLRVDVTSGEVKPLTGLKTILLRPAASLVSRLPGLAVVKEPPPRVAPRTLLDTVVADDETEEE